MVILVIRAKNVQIKFFIPIIKSDSFTNTFLLKLLKCLVDVINHNHVLVLRFTLAVQDTLQKRTIK